MPRLIENLRRLNQKERFYVVAKALQGADTFTLDPEFRCELSATLGIVVPPDAFAAMDYHLDWLYAALYTTNYGASGEVHLNEDKESTITGNPADMDFVIAFENGAAETHLVLIEAKGATGWKNKQMNSKAKRLRVILGDDSATRWPNIPGLRVHFVLMSPGNQRRLEVEGYPSWMNGASGTPAYIRMPMPDNLLKITRCDVDGKPGREGTHWKLGK